jgi:C1A family cysteine protease
MKKFVIALLFLMSFMAFSAAVAADNAKTPAEAIDKKSGEMTIEERMEHLGLIIPDDVKARFERLNRQPEPDLLVTDEVFDWRLMGGVTPVKDQASCGSCWDFAATGATESAALITDGVEWDLSEQQGLSCNTYGYGCGGGWMEAIYELFTDYGAIHESCMPYEADDQIPCIQDSCIVMVTIEGATDIANNINSIKNALLTGPVSSCFTVHSGFHWNCYQNSYTSPNHAIVIVGWDDSLCGTGGWICKNSWGIGWGDEGFFYLPYGSCGIGNYTELPVYSGSEIPELTYNPDSLVIDVPLGGQNSDIIHLGNLGEGDMLYRLKILLPVNQDSFGYYWYDSDNPNGPDYNWIDITGIGNEVQFITGDLDDGNSGPLDLGFDFEFYGETHNSICVCTNGWASFTDGSSVEWGNQPIPNPEPPNSMLAAFYDDLNPENGGNIYFYTNNADTAIISWVEVPDWRQEGTFTFEIILVAPESIVYQYNELGPGRLDEMSIGIENEAGSVGLQVAYNRYYTSGQKAVEFYLGEPLDWLAISDPSGTVPPMSSRDIQITCSAGDHPTGIYEATLKLSTNDPYNLYNEIPVTMNVGSAVPFVSIDMIPDNPPITVPAGGSFTYTGILANNTDENMMGDVWLMLDVPGHGMYGPIQRYNNVRLAPRQSITIPGIEQEVPDYAPLGTYRYVAYCGDYRSTIMDSASFDFTVVAPAGGASGGWNVTGWFDDVRTIVPSVTALYTNYPNPFNAATSICYDLGKEGKVSLRIYNILGQEVDVIADGYQHAGRHNITWNANKFSSGIYYYRLTADDFSETRKMVLVK